MQCKHTIHYYRYLYCILHCSILVAQARVRGFTEATDSVPILLRGVNCNGMEGEILDCEFNGPTSADRHNKDSGIFCYNKPSSMQSVVKCRSWSTKHGLTFKA